MATLPGIVEMLIRPGQGVAEASELPQEAVAQEPVSTNELSISPVAQLKSDQAFLDAGYPERIQMLHQAIAQERKMPRVKRRFADLAPEKQREFTTGLLTLGAEAAPPAQAEGQDSAQKEAPAESIAPQGQEPPQTIATPAAPSAEAPPPTPPAIQPSPSAASLSGEPLVSPAPSTEVSAPSSEGQPAQQETPAAGVAPTPAQAPPGQPTRLEQLTQMRDALAAQQQQGQMPGGIAPQAEMGAPQPITNETIRGLVDQAAGYPGVDPYQSQISQNKTLVDAYDAQVAKYPAPIRKVFSFPPVRKALLIGDTIDTAVAKALTEAFGFPATIVNQLSKLNTAWYQSKGMESGKSAPQAPVEGQDFRRTALKILNAPSYGLDAPKGELQIIQRIAEEVTGTVIMAPVLRKAIPVIRAMTEDEFAKFAMQQVGQALASGGAAVVAHNKMENPLAEIVAQLTAGGVTGAAQNYMTTDGALKVLRSMKGFFTGGDRKNMQGRIENALREGFKHEAQVPRAVEEAAEVEAVVPGVRFPLGERTQSKTALQAQIDLMRKSKEFESTMQAAREGNIELLTEALQKRLGASAEGVTPVNIQEAFQASEAAGDTAAFGRAYKDVQAAQGDVAAAQSAKALAEHKTEQAMGAAQETLQGAEADVAAAKQGVVGKREQLDEFYQRAAQAAERKAAAIKAKLDADLAQENEKLYRELDVLQAKYPKGMEPGPFSEVIGETVRKGTAKSYLNARRAVGRLSREVDPGGMIQDTSGDFYPAILAKIGVASDDMLPTDTPRSIRNFFDVMKQRAMQNRTAQGAADAMQDDLEGLTGGLASFAARPQLPVNRARNMDPKDLDLVTYVKDHMGGIKTEGEELATELRALSGRESGFKRPTAGAPPTLINNKGGKTLQELAEGAAEAGFIDTPDKRELLDALRDSVTRGIDVWSRFGQGPEGMMRASGLFDEFVKKAKDLQPEDYEGVLLSFRDLMRFRSAILQEKRGLGMDQRQTEALLDSFERMIRNKMRLMAEKAADEGDPDVLARYDIMRRFAREELPKYEINVGKDILGKTLHTTEFKTHPADIMKAVWHGSGERSSFDEALKLLSGPDQDVEQGLQAVWTWVSNDFYQKVVSQGTGKVIPKKYRDWMSLNKNRLDLLPPEMQQRLKTVGRIGDTVAEIEAKAAKWLEESNELANLQAKGAAPVKQTKTIADPALATEVSALEDEVSAAQKGVPVAQREATATLRDADKALATAQAEFNKKQDIFAKTAVGRVLSGENPDEELYKILDKSTTSQSELARRNREVRELFEAAPDQDTKDGLLWLMWRHFNQVHAPAGTPTTVSGDVPIMSGTVIQQFIDKYKPVLETVIPDDVKTLETIAKGFSIARSGERMPAGIVQDLPGVLSAEKTTVRQAAQGIIHPLVAVPSSIGIGYLWSRPLLAAALVGGSVFGNIWAGWHDTKKLHLLQSIFANSDALTTVALLMTPNAKPSVVLPRLYATIVNLGLGARADDPPEQQPATTEVAPSQPPTNPPE